MPHTTLAQYDVLKEKIAGYGYYSVAYSGGVDSSLLFKATFDVFGDKATALLADSVLLSPNEVDRASTQVASIGGRLQIFHYDPLAWPEFLTNPTDRCYHCKKKIYSKFLEFLRTNSQNSFYDGSNLNDLHDDRPGRRALVELDIPTPLIEAGFDKATIRRVARELDLPTWNKPSSSCLATRIPHGLKIDHRKISLVASCEQTLLGLGFHGCRTRLLDDEARAVSIEITEEAFTTFTDTKIRNKVVAALRNKGFKQIFLNLAGR
ncbi:MAG: ATP-dependent sacrificial sulfur transferase LarE [Proteobacteria bacterium]|nr:ATP-dependent sacrificial sulfur transferase LarE [Pseudomonadota bacterium]MBU1686514.1 ATP-dependent sacrificial sulfur transferase LarE [Pseudomonadota bacterium]